MLSFATIACALWAVGSMYVVSIDWSDYVGVERHRGPTVSNQTIINWLWREIWISSTLAGLLVAMYFISPFFHTSVLSPVRWLMVIGFVGQKLWIRRHIKFLKAQDKEYWKDKKMPKHIKR